MPNRTLAMFPGQGSQYVGMGKAVYETFPYCRSLYDEASEILRFDLKKLCFEGPEDSLKLTANTQPAILTTSIAVWNVLHNELGFAPRIFAGHSLGEYSALVASGKLDFAAAIRLVRARGEAMQSAVPEGEGAMAAVMNLESAKLDEICNEATLKGHPVQTANYNSPQQLVIAGARKGVETVCQKLEGMGIRYVVLNVSAPFHSSLMAPARVTMTPLLQSTHLIATETEIIANLTGKIARPYTTQFLIEQIDHPVRWIETMQTAQDLQLKTFIEIGPSRVLLGLAKRSVSRETKLIGTDDISQTLPTLKSQLSE